MQYVCGFDRLCLGLSWGPRVRQLGEYDECRQVVVDTFAEQRMRDVTTMAMEMDEDAEEDLRDLDKMFLEIDANNDGTLTFDELLEGAMKVREFQNRLRVMDIDQNDLQQLFLMLDHDGGGTIDPDEFKKTLSRWAARLPRNIS